MIVIGSQALEIGDCIMNDEVDLSVFEDLNSRLNVGSLDELIYGLCENDLDADLTEIIGQCPNGKWNDPDIKKWYQDYLNELDSILDEFGYEFIEQEGGREGVTECCYGVFKLKDKIYKAEYSYHRYNGDEYDGITNTLKEVNPVEKTITVYE